MNHRVYFWLFHTLLWSCILFAIYLSLCALEVMSVNDLVGMAMMSYVGVVAPFVIPALVILFGFPGERLGGRKGGGQADDYGQAQVSDDRLEGGDRLRASE
jgi:hypothetical protein